MIAEIHAWQLASFAVLSATQADFVQDALITPEPSSCDC